MLLAARVPDLDEEPSAHRWPQQVPGLATDARTSRCHSHAFALAQRIARLAPLSRPAYARTRSGAARPTPQERSALTSGLVGSKPSSRNPMIRKATTVITAHKAGARERRN